METEIKSPITGGVSNPYCIKEGVQYFQCVDTKTLFTPTTLNQANMVGGTGEQERNVQQNANRIARIRSLAPNGSVLDYGCGNGLLLKDMLASGLQAEGYDPYSDQFNAKPKHQFDVVTMIEVIEHTAYPFLELDQIFFLLKPGGTLYVETSFSNWVDADHPYLNPSIGHCTVFSHAGLDAVAHQKGFKRITPIDGNTRLYRKPVA